MKNRVKVLRIIARLNNGGPSRHVLILNSGLNSERYSSHLAIGRVSSGEGDLTHLAREMNIDTSIIPELSREISPLKDMITFFKLCSLIRRIKPDIVHTHTAKAGALGRMAAIVNRVPVKIHTFHGHIFHSYFGRIKTAIFIMIERFLSLFTSRIIAISHTQLDELMNGYGVIPKERGTVVPLGLDLEPYLRSGKVRDIRPEYSLHKDTLLVGIVGRLEKVKNHTLFLEAVKKVLKSSSGLKVKFLVIGDGTLKKALESYAEQLGISGSVIFTGWQSDLVTIYKNLDVVCLTSLNEGTPISLIEAMACSRPVLSTDVGGVRDVVEDNISGILSPNEDVESFSKALKGLLCDKAMRERLGNAAKNAVMTKFSKKRLIEDIEKLYEIELTREKIL